MNSSKSREEVSQHNTWKAYPLLVIVSIIIPMVGIILGVVGYIKEKEGSLALIVLGVLSWIIWGALVSLLVALYFY